MSIARSPGSLSHSCPHISVVNLPDESKNRARLMNSPVAATGTVSNVSRTKIGLQFLLVSSVIVVLFSKVVVSIVVEVLSSIVEISVLVILSWIR